MRQSTGNECIKSLIKLRREEEMIEKALDHFLDNVQTETEASRVLRNEQIARTLERKKLTNSLRTIVLDVKKCLNEVKMSVEDMQEGRKIEIGSFKEQLILLSTKIREFKKNSPMEILTREETELDRETRSACLALENRKNPRFYERKKSTERLVTSCQDFSGAKDFDGLVARTGHTQNWSEPDHLLFLKVRKSCKNVASIVSAMRKKCPDLTADRIVDHEAWYKIYLDLREKQRAAIREWREKRDARKREIALNKATEFEKHSETRCGRTNEESVENDSSTSSFGVFENSDTMTNKGTGSIERRESIRHRREERERARSLECEKTRSEIDSLRTRKENLRLAHARAVKSAALARREMKIEEATSSGSTTSNDAKHSTRVPSRSKDIETIQSFRRRDDEFLRRRNTALARKRSGLTNASSNKIHNRSNAETSTLLNPTKVWIERCKAGRDPEVVEPSRGVIYVNDIPKLGACNWKNQRSE